MYIILQLLKKGFLYFKYIGKFIIFSKHQIDLPPIVLCMNLIRCLVPKDFENLKIYIYEIKGYFCKIDIILCLSHLISKVFNVDQNLHWDMMCFQI